jgi:hypothetical protein
LPEYYICEKYVLCESRHVARDQHADQRVSAAVSRMRYRKLRIAWSVVWGILAVLLVVLWVRSYSHTEGLFVPLKNAEGLRLASVRGRMGYESDHAVTKWECVAESVKLAKFDWDRWDRNTPHWIFRKDHAVVVPHWFPLAIVATLAAAPWLPSRFSLRALLIATTLVAVVLGLIVYAARG